VLKLSSNRLQGFELRAIRFLHEPFAWGASPLDPTRSTGPDGSGDGGLVERGGVSVRAWPASRGTKLVETVRVPVGGKLSVQVARSSISSSEALVGRVAAGELTAEVKLPVNDTDWHALTLDLAALAGQEVELEFLAEGTTGGSPTPRADVLFGAPLVFGTLPEDRRPNILLVTLDTTRFDALGSSQPAATRNGETQPVSQRVFTPALDAFAASSFVFENAWSAGNSTQPSHASIITGISIQDHSLTDNFGMLSDGAVTLAELLRTAGYQTAAVTCQRAISPASGFGQGFDLFVPAEAVSGADGRLAVDDAIAWLEEWAAEGERPFFLWVHVFDPHTPYELPDDYLTTYAGEVGGPPAKQVSPPTLPQVEVVPPEMAFLGDINSRDHVDYLYHAEVAYTDKLMDDLLSAVDRTGIADHTLSVITADHGEFLGERGNFYNHRGLFPETLHVPLVLHLPGQLEGRHIADRVTNRDIVPTVLSALGLIDPGGPRDLVAVAASGADPERRLWFEHANRLEVGCRDAQYHFFTVLRDGYRFGMRELSGPDGPTGGATPIPKGAVFIYDWTKDPGLTHNLADEDPELKAHYLGLLEEYRASAQPVGRERRAVSAEEEARLKALGYTGD
jgi:arylsulfatase A-like enzyme